MQKTFFLRGDYPNSLFIRPITPQTVLDIGTDLRNTNGGGYLEFNSRFLKDILGTIAEPLSIIFNKCIHGGYFPNILKIAEVIPIFKSGDPSLPGNYRPISILTFFFQNF